MYSQFSRSFIYSSLSILLYLFFFIYPEKLALVPDMMFESSSKWLGKIALELSKQPGYEYLADLEKHNDINWKQVELIQKNWDYKQEGLTPAMAALITIAVTVATGGTGGPAASVAAAAGGGATGAAASAAFVSLASQATITLINNKGDISKTLNDLASSDTVRSLATAAITAGVAAQLGFNPSEVDTFSDKLTNGIAEGFTNAVADTAINGVSFEDALKNSLRSSLVDVFAAEAFTNLVKPIDADTFARNLTHKLMAAGVGCVTAEAKQQSCDAGALGAAVGEMTADYLANSKYQYVINNNGDVIRYLSKADQQYIIDTSMLITGSIAAVSGMDVNEAADMSKIAVINNATIREQITNISKETLTLLKDTADKVVQTTQDYIDYFKIESAASGLTGLRSLGEHTNSDFVYLEGGMNFGGVKVYGTFVVNVHNGNVYVPITANASMNNDSKLSVGGDVGIGKVINVPAGASKGRYTDEGLNDYGTSYTASYGGGSVTYAETADGNVKMVSTAVGKSIGGTNKLVGLDVGASGMKPFDLSKYNIAYDPNKKVYINTKPSRWN